MNKIAREILFRRYAPQIRISRMKKLRSWIATVADYAPCSAVTTAALVIGGIAWAMCWEVLFA